MSTLSVRGPRYPFADLGAFDALVRRSFGPFAPADPGRSVSADAPRRTGFVPAAEVVHEGDDAVVRLELPGVDAARDVTVDVTGHRLVVRGERRSTRTSEPEQQEQSAGHAAAARPARRVTEVRYGSFERSFALPEHVGPDAVSASYDQGVLSVRIAGVHTRPASHRIPIGGPTAEPTDAPDTTDTTDTGDTTEAGPAAA